MSETTVSDEDLEWLINEFQGLSYSVESEYVCTAEGAAAMKADRDRAEAIVSRLRADRPDHEADGSG